MPHTKRAISALPRRRLSAFAALFAAGASHAAEDDIAALRQANAAFDGALRSRDISTVMALHAAEPGITAAHPRDRAVQRGPAAVRRSWEEAFARFSALEVTMADPVIQVFGDVGIVAGLEVIAGQRAADGVVIRFDAMTTNVFIRRGGRWLMAHHHATTVPA